jgi:hypothetical protein
MAWTANFTVPTILNVNVEMEVNMEASVELPSVCKVKRALLWVLVENADLRKCWYCPSNVQLSRK